MTEFYGSVADAAVRKVNRGETEYLSDIPEGSEMERQLRAKAVELNGRVPETFGPASRVLPDDASEFSVSAPSTHGLLSRTGTQLSLGSTLRTANLSSTLHIKPKSGPTELPPQILVEKAKVKAEKEPTRAKKLWNEVRHNINSPVKIILDNHSRNGLIGGGQAPTFQGDARTYR
jgi:hypothetical protein